MNLLGTSVMMSMFRFSMVMLLYKQNFLHNSKEFIHILSKRHHSHSWLTMHMRKLRGAYVLCICAWDCSCDVERWRQSKQYAARIKSVQHESSFEWMHWCKLSAFWCKICIISMSNLPTNHALTLIIGTHKTSLLFLKMYSFSLFIQ